jgi:hypothetical protein
VSRPQCPWQAADGRTCQPVHWRGATDRTHCVWKGAAIRASNCCCYYSRAARSHQKGAANWPWSDHPQALGRLIPVPDRSAQAQRDRMPIANCRAYWATLPTTVFGSAPPRMPRALRATAPSPIEAEPAATSRLRSRSKLHETPQIQPFVAQGWRCQTLRVKPADGTNLEIMRAKSILFQRCQNISDAHLQLSRRVDAVYRLDVVGCCGGLASPQCKPTPQALPGLSDCAAQYRRHISR